MDEIQKIIDQGVQLLNSGDRVNAHLTFLNALNLDPKNVRSLKYALITSATQEEANYYIHRLKSLGVRGENFEKITSWVKTLPTLPNGERVISKENQTSQQSQNKKEHISKRRPLLIISLSLISFCAICSLLIFLPNLLNTLTSKSNYQEPQSNNSVQVKRTLPPIWTPTIYHSPTSVKSPTPETTPTFPPTNTPIPFRGYEAVAMNNNNYPIVNSVSFYSHPENYYAKRLMISGFIVALGSIDLGNGPENVIQVGLDLNEPAGQINARSPVLALRFDSNSKLYVGQKIDVYGSGGGSIQGKNVTGGNAGFPIIFGEWYTPYKLVYQQNYGTTNNPGHWYNYPYP